MYIFLPPSAAFEARLVCKSRERGTTKPGILNFALLSQTQKYDWLSVGDLSPSGGVLSTRGTARSLQVTKKLLYTLYNKLQCFGKLYKPRTAQNSPFCYVPMCQRFVNCGCSKSVRAIFFPGLHWFWFTMHCDWSRKLAPPSQPIRCKTKTNHDLVTHVFPRLSPVTCVYFEFLLAPSDIFLCSDWLL